MNDKKVFILLSVYNGEKYLSKQMDSLLAQTYPNIEIHVRDDGSTDRSCALIRSYMEKDNRIHLYPGENLGYKKSFFWLVGHCRGADYYAYCDQDDIWLPDKIEHSVKSIYKYDKIPALYIADFYWSNAEAEPVRQNLGYKKKHTLEKYITMGDMNTYGFTEVFNEEAAREVRKRDCSEHCVHDQAVYLYCFLNGKVVWGKKPLAYYRRFGNNTSAQELVGGNQFTHLIWRIKTYLLKDNSSVIYDRFRDYINVYRDVHSQTDIDRIEFYLNKGHRIQKAAYPGRYRDSVSDEFQIRLMFLLGRM